MQCCTYLHVALLLLRQAGIPDTCILCARVSYACVYQFIACVQTEHVYLYTERVSLPRVPCVFYK